VTVSAGASVTIPNGVRSSSVTINDDAVGTIDLSGMGQVAQSGMMAICCQNANPSATRPALLFVYRAIAQTSPVGMSGDTTNVTYNNAASAPTGTTGTDTKLNFYITGDSKIYIENRLGAAVTFKYTLFSG